MSDEKLTWADLETMGLDPDLPLIEVGFIVTDLDLNILGSYESTVWSYSAEWIYQRWLEQNRAGTLADDQKFVLDMHTRSGLFDRARTEKRTTSQVESEILTFLVDHHAVGSKPPLCGSSVDFDKNFFKVWMPSVVNLFSHRVIDVSTLKETARRYMPERFKSMETEAYGPNATKAHTAIADLHDSIAEYRWYLQNFLRLER